MVHGYRDEVICAFSNQSHVMETITATMPSWALRCPFIRGPPLKKKKKRKQIGIASPAGLEISIAECGVAFQSMGYQSKGQLPHLGE